MGAFSTRRLAGQQQEDIETPTSGCLRFPVCHGDSCVIGRVRSNSSLENQKRKLYATLLGFNFVILAGCVKFGDRTAATHANYTSYWWIELQLRVEVKQRRSIDETE